MSKLPFPLTGRQGNMLVTNRNMRFVAIIDAIIDAGVLTLRGG